MGKIFSKEYEIHFYEVDYRLKCTMESILKFIEDVGTEQSEKLGGGMEYLLERGMAWVFYQYEVLVKRYPNYGEKIKVITEPFGFNKFFVVRNYDMYDEKGEKIIEAKAIFFLINIDKRRTMRVPLEQYDMYGIDSSTKLDFKIDKIEKLQEPMHINSFKVRYSDIDVNRHVNNTKYVQWVLDSIPVEILNDYELERIKVNFEKECIYGVDIKVLTEIREEDGKITTLHKIETIDGKVLTNLIGHWKKYIV